LATFCLARIVLQLVLKAIKPTQRDSAENEYRIAQKVAAGGGDR
jgi:hypothetical protein